MRGIGLIASKIGSALTYYMYNGHGDVVQLVNSGGTAITKSYDYDAFGVEKGQTLYGDVNGDGKVNISDSILLSQYLGGQSVVINMKESDVSGNGVIDQADSLLLGQYIAEIVVTLGPSPIDSPNPFRYCGEYFDKETNTVYLRARYYNPKSGRFMTEDTIIFTKSKMPNGTELIDPLSLNLYTYCYNNPIRYFDPSGNAPWYTLPFYGYIHYQVQLYLAAQFSLATEVACYESGKYVGRADLYNETEKLVWEVKPFGTDQAAALNQLNGYADLLGAKPGHTLGSGKFAISDGTFDIRIYSYNNGLIYYDFKLRPEDSKVFISEPAKNYSLKYMDKIKENSSGNSNVPDIKLPTLPKISPPTGDSLPIIGPIITLFTKLFG